MSDSPPPPSSPLFDQLENVYPLACVLAGTDDADALLLRVAERAADTPTNERPNDVQSWLLELLLQENQREETHYEESSGIESAAADTRDDFRTYVARQRVKDAVPTALAACSVEERFLLALDVSSVSDDLEKGSLALALNRTPADVPTLEEDAWTTFQDHLFQTLSPTECSLVADKLPDEAIRTAVREAFANHLPTMPSSLRGRVRSALENKPADGEPEPEESSQKADGKEVPLMSWSSVRNVLVSLFVLALVAAGAIGIAYWPESPSEPPPSSSLSTFSAQHVEAVEPVLSTDRPERAEEYVASTWGREITLPGVSGLRLEGVGRLRFAAGSDVPVFLYGDSSDTGRVAVFAYTYALVDDLEPEATLGRPEREALAQNRHLVAKDDSAGTGVLWRHQDAIFVAVAPSLDVNELRGRIRP